MLRIETLAAARIHWSGDDWKSVQDVSSQDAGLGVHIADLPTRGLAEGARIRFTFHWLEADRCYIAERIAIDHYRELIRYFADDDPATRTMLEGILTIEEEHANDMHDLLVAHEGRPTLASR